MKVHVPGYTTLTGNPVAIMQMMHDARVLDDLEGDDLIDEIKGTAWRCFGIALQVTGDTYEERAESLLLEMHRNNMIKIEED